MGKGSRVGGDNCVLVDFVFWLLSWLKYLPFCLAHVVWYHITGKYYYYSETPFNVVQATITYSRDAA